MVYEYNSNIVNRNTVDEFYNKKNFVGYILPNGEIFKCKQHNISNAHTVLLMDLMILDKEFDKKSEILDVSTNNKMLELIANHLKRMSHDEIHALLDYITNDNAYLSDLLVSYFGCHLVTRLNKDILTSEIDYHCFYNYLLNDFTITNVGKVIYDDKEKKFRRVSITPRNDDLYEEIERIKAEAKNGKIELFYKSR